jgi:hypothetical protein
MSVTFVADDRAEISCWQERVSCFVFQIWFE